MWLLVVAPVLWMVWQALTDRLGANPIESLQKESGEWTLRLLACSLAVTPLIRITRWGWLISQRRFLGLSAFFYALGHLSIYVGLDQFFNLSDIIDDVLEHRYITVGMLAFVLMIPLAVTSTKGWIRRMGGKRWNKLHRLVYVSAVAGCIHFIWSVKQDIEEPLVYMAVFLVLFALRFVWRRRAGRSQSNEERSSDKRAAMPAA